MISEERAYNAYIDFLALSMHFYTDKYDYFKYNGEVKASPDSFHKRNDRYQFHKLSRRNDYHGLIIANCIELPKRPWVGELLSKECNDIYIRWDKANGSRMYKFKEEVNAIQDLKNDLLCIDGEHPELLNSYIRGTISIETLIMIDDNIPCFDVWNKKLKTNVILRGIERKCKKYKPFIRNANDKKQIRQILIEKVNENDGRL